MEDHGSDLQTWGEMVARYNKQNAKIGADDIKCSAVESMAPKNIKPFLQLHARRFKKNDAARIDIYAYFVSCTGEVVKSESTRSGIRSRFWRRSDGCQGRSKEKGNDQGKGSKQCNV